ncbi:hypothetical protein J1N35_022780 [Gossypium stocksii]|uniref:Uncharacterized protein n=1 Tax=Gossypium stocksii TaxID=47602 RepID=A0A9D4A3T1_9ROSI|nr:hypothetical protein J1N35_022780 [Gossypium stocksii]
MSKEGSSKGSVKVLTEYERVAATPKFKWRKVLAVGDFLPRCGRGTALEFRLHRQIMVDQTSQGKSKLILQLEVWVKFF